MRSKAGISWSARQRRGRGAAETPLLGRMRRTRPRRGEVAGLSPDRENGSWSPKLNISACAGREQRQRVALHDRPWRLPVLGTGAVSAEHARSGRCYIDQKRGARRAREKRPACRKRTLGEEGGDSPASAVVELLGAKTSVAEGQPHLNRQLAEQRGRHPVLKPGQAAGCTRAWSRSRQQRAQRYQRELEQRHL